MDDATLARLVVRLDADVSRLETGLNRAVTRARSSARQIEQSGLSQALNNAMGAGRNRAVEEGIGRIGVLGAGISALGPAGLAAAAGIGAMAGALEGAMRTAEWAEHLGDVANALHLTTEQVQALDFAATAAGLPVEQMRSTLAGLQQAMGAALGSDRMSGRMQRVFAELGISTETLRGLRDVTQLLPLLAQGFQRLEAASPARAAALGERLHIDPEVLHELEQGRDHIEELISAAQRYGVVMDESMVRRSGEAADAMRTASAVMNAELRVAFAELTPAITGAANGFVHAIQALNGFMDTCRDALTPVFDLINAIRQIPFAGIAGPFIANAPAAIRMGMGFGPADPRANARRYLQGQHQLAVAQALGAQDDLAGVYDAMYGPATRVPYSYTPPSTSGGGRARTPRVGRGGGRAASDPLHGMLPQWTFPSAERGDLIDLTDLRGDIQQVAASGLHDAAAEWIQGLQDQHAELVSQWHDIIQGGLDAAIHGGWKGLAQYMAQTLERALINSLSNSLSNLLTGGQIGGGGILGSIASFLIGHNAGGTDNWRGGLSWVGERGPELLNIPRGAQVLSHAASMAAMVGGRGGGTVHQTIHLHAEGAVLSTELIQTMQQIGMMAYSSAVRTAKVSIPADLQRRALRRLA